VFLEKINDTLIEQLLDDILHRVVLLQFFKVLFGRHFIRSRERRDAGVELFRGHANAFFLRDAPKEKPDLNPFASILTGGGIDLLFLLVDDLARNAAFLVFADDIVNDIASLMLHERLG
jgi:hypothetical protein